jgi:hypothetical protein
MRLPLNLTPLAAEPPRPTVPTGSDSVARQRNETRTRRAETAVQMIDVHDGVGARPELDIMAGSRATG